jgi:Spy/CpxP family protein refolding chaperone
MTDKTIAAIRGAVVIAGALLLLPSSLALAAGEETSAPLPSSPEGIGIFIMLVGLAALGLIGATLYGRQMPMAQGMEDDELIEDNAE